MADFETMPIGTRAAMVETAELLRSYERHHRDIAAKTGARTGRDEKAQRNADAAAKLEALLEQPGIARTTPAVEGVGSITGGGPRGQEITPSRQPVQPIICKKTQGIEGTQEHPSDGLPLDAC